MDFNAKQSVAWIAGIDIRRGLVAADRVNASTPAAGNRAGGPLGVSPRKCAGEAQESQASGGRCPM
jgi:hypothetical protein